MRSRTVSVVRKTWLLQVIGGMCVDATLPSRLLDLPDLRRSGGYPGTRRAQSLIITVAAIRADEFDLRFSLRCFPTFGRLQ
jgi:hypothetical protein